MSGLDWAVGFLYQEKVREREAELACAAWEACGGNGRMGSERLISRRLAAGFYDDPGEKPVEGVIGREARAEVDRLHAVVVKMFAGRPTTVRFWPDDAAERYAAAWSPCRKLLSGASVGRVKEFAGRGVLELNRAGRTSRGQARNGC
jgi:hypothetical protein